MIPHFLVRFILTFIQYYFVSDFFFCLKAALFGLLLKREYSETVHSTFVSCYISHKQKFTGSKPLFLLIKVDLDK